MSHVIFFTKPGCLTGLKQIETLKEAGHTVEVRNILEHPWTADELLSYFGELQFKQWFNKNAPRIKTGEVNPDEYDRESALAAMLQDHLLIRRPLLQVGVRRKCGFDLDEINSWIGVTPAALERHDDLQSCSASTTETTECVQ
ncbi:ArsC/Spx/MgsR family protein [Geobacter sp. SVR]|uniref:ArsC/Spx/MgsR family protein n=1 Tax=Geobacter sp. SVR TaxID=2495594 RepID=UPI00143EF7EA|nr:ArsC/Spx/MgsR family protein [Geobacter sp. SVR]BCS54167.1 hypothetical protein GSVR_24750 [Geobacter sp. SVR]GCF85975.1 hypothetical protein GSbR_25750 [Geobacter sp. SVR]